MGGQRRPWKLAVPAWNLPPLRRLPWKLPPLPWKLSLLPRNFGGSGGKLVPVPGYIEASTVSTGASTTYTEDSTEVVELS